jgi:hypothetical protein
MPDAGGLLHWLHTAVNSAMLLGSLACSLLKVGEAYWDLNCTGVL